MKQRIWSLFNPTRQFPFGRGLIQLGVIASLLIVTALSGTLRATAAADSVTFTPNGSASCTNTSMTIMLARTANVTSTSHLDTRDLVVVNSTTLINSSGGFNGPFIQFIPGFTYNIANTSQPYQLTFVESFSEGGVSIGAVTAVYQCSGGTSSLVSISNSAFIPGPGIPAGFVLRTITCDVAVFQNAGGAPVATGEHIINGQTWFVSPTPVKDNKSKWWTEIFAGGSTDGFIPTSCVGGKPANYAGS